jgi:hypothetical protein
MAMQLGTQLGRYEIRSKLGEGGMEEWYLMIARREYQGMLLLYKGNKGRYCSRQSASRSTIQGTTKNG